MLRFQICKIANCLRNKQVINFFQPRVYFAKIRRNDEFLKKEEEDEEEDTLTIKDIRIPKEKLDLNFSRSSGPGGQNVNKVNTKAEIRFHLQNADWLDKTVKAKFKELYPNSLNANGEVVITSQIGRSQEHNTDDAIEKLRNMVFQASLKEKERKTVIPSETNNEEKRRLDSKKKKSDVKKMRNSKFSDW